MVSQMAVKIWSHKESRRHEVESCMAQGEKTRGGLAHKHFPFALFLENVPRQCTNAMAEC